MLSQQEAGMGGALHVTVCHLLFRGQVTEEVQVHEGTNGVVLSLRSHHGIRQSELEKPSMAYAFGMAVIGWTSSRSSGSPTNSTPVTLAKCLTSRSAPPYQQHPGDAYQVFDVMPQPV